MEGSTALVPVPGDALAQLNERERYAFEQHVRKREPPLSPTLAVKLFELFLAGKNCEEIRRLNPSLGLGQIVHARIEHEWDRQRSEYTAALYGRAKERLSQVTAETALTVANMLAAKNKLIQDRLLLYLQSGDEAHIADLGLGGIEGYRKLVDVLQKLTGADQVKTVRGEVHHHHTGDPLAAIGTRAPTSGQAETAVEVLLEAELVER